jgi:hypothetical protein
MGWPGQGHMPRGADLPGIMDQVSCIIIGIPTKYRYMINIFSDPCLGPFKTLRLFAYAVPSTVVPVRRLGKTQNL